MKLPKLDLKQNLFQLGDENLSKILGQDRLATLSRLINKPINLIMMVDLIHKRLGDQIFSDAMLRGHIIYSLRDDYKSYVYKGNPNYKMNEDDEKRLINASWDRRSNYFHRLIEIFNLDQNYLPEIPIERKTLMTIFPETNNSNENLNIFEKFLKFIISIIILLFNFFKKKEENINPLNLFDFQLRVKEKILQDIQSGRKRMIIHMPTGSGKTRTTLSSLVDIMNKNKIFCIIWLAHTDELCDQAIETMEYIWKKVGKEKLNIHRVIGQTNPKIEDEKSFIVTTYQKLSSMRTGRESQVQILEKIRRNINIIVADEAHMSPADTFSSSINFLNSVDETVIIGLTATPGRGIKDSQNEELANFFGKYKISITDENNSNLTDPIKYLQNKKILSKIKAFRIATNFSFELSQDQQLNILNNFQIHDALIKKMAKDEERNLCIISHLIDLVNKGKSIIVFACSLEHSKLLNEVCILLNIRCASIDDKTSFASRKLYIQKFKNKEIDVIFNYGVLSTGFDAPNTNAILIARFTSSPIVYSQMLGRGLRGTEVKGNEECWLLDLKDNLKGMPDERTCFTMYNHYYDREEEYNL